MSDFASRALRCLLGALLVIALFPVGQRAFAQSDDEAAAQLTEETAASEPELSEEAEEAEEVAEESAPEDESGETGSDEPSDEESSENDSSVESINSDGAFDEVVEEKVFEASDDEGSQVQKKDEAAAREASAQADDRAAAISVEKDGPLGIGDVFGSDDNDAGLMLRFTITGSDTVEVGVGKVELYDYESSKEGWVQTGVADIPQMATLQNWRFGGKVSIPSTVTHDGRTYTVTAIGDHAFGFIYRYYYLANSPVLRTQQIAYSIAEIRIPSTVTRIGDSAFEGCQTLTRITFTGSNEVKTIGEAAFGQCRGLPDDALAGWDKLETIGGRAFEKTKFSKITIPASVSSIGALVLSEAAAEEVRFAEGSAIRSVQDHTFEWAKSLRHVIGLPAAVTSIGDYAFRSSGLEQFNIPRDCQSLGDSAFYGCSDLVSVTFDGDKITSLPTALFLSCKQLADIDIPDNITAIGQACFADTGITSVSLGSSLAALETRAFGNCPSLTEVRISDKSPLMRIEERVFDGCESLTMVQLPDTVRFVGAHAFRGCSSLSEIAIPKQCKTLDVYAFENCSSLETVVFRGDASNLSMATSAFYRCDALQAVVWEGKRARSAAFLNAEPEIYCTLAFYASQEDAEAGAEPISLFSVKRGVAPAAASAAEIWQGGIPEAPEGWRWVTEPGFSFQDEIADSFYVYAMPARPPYAIGETFTATTEEGVEFVCRVTSDGTEGVRAVSVGVGGELAVAANTPGACTLPDTVVGEDGQVYRITSIASEAFSGCTRLKEVTIPKGCTNVERMAFYRCQALTTVRFESDASSLGNESQFTGCNSIELVVFAGKKANVTFGMSDPEVYYTVRCYASENDMKWNDPSAVLTVKRGTRLGSLSDADVLVHTSPRELPAVPLGYQWAYEPGFSGTSSLSDSCYMYLDGIGFQADVTLKGSSQTTAKCWFKPISAASDEKPGTCQVGVSLDGFPAVAQSVRGTVVIPETVVDPASGLSYRVTAVGSYAFGATDEALRPCYVTNVDFSNSNVTTIDEFAFYRAATMAGSLSLPASLSSLGKQAFEGTGFSAVQFAAGCKVTMVPSRAFAGCPNLSSVTLAPSVLTVGAQAFLDCSSLASIQWGGVERALEDSCFEGTALSTINIPASMETIGNRAFYRVWKASELHFLGNASAITFGVQSFTLDDVTALNPSTLTRGVNSLLRGVYFHSKKAPAIRSYVATGYATGSAQNNYTCYYALDTYNSYDDFLAQRKASTVFASERKSYADSLPVIPNGYAWELEGGVSSSALADESRWAYRANDFSFTRIELQWPEGDQLGKGDVRYYTGDFIKPLAVKVYWGYGTSAMLLEEGKDWSYDTSLGTRKDGYLNNLFMSTAASPASVTLKGMGNFAGSNSKSFTITGQLAMGSESIQAEPVTATYTGLALQARPVVRFYDRYGTATVLEQGSDYTVDALDAVDAGTYDVVIRGAGTRFSADTSLHTTLTVRPMDINSCDIGAPVVRWLPDGSCEVVNVSIVNPNTGAALRMGRDFTAVATDTENGGRVQLRVRGAGNFSGFYTDEVVAEEEEPEGGANGTEGAGTGLGSGSAGSGSGEGAGNGLAGSKGESSQGSLFGGTKQASLSVAPSEKGAVDNTTVADAADAAAKAELQGGGGASGNPEQETLVNTAKRIFQMNDEETPLALFVDVRPIPLSIMLTVLGAVIVAGAFWRRNKFIRDVRPKVSRRS